MRAEFSVILQFAAENPCSKVPVWRCAQVLASLADGDAAEDILADFPSLTAEHIKAAIAFAAASAEEDLPIPATPQIWRRLSSMKISRCKPRPLLPLLNSYE
jgi:hypothetical protein